MFFIFITIYVLYVVFLYILIWYGIIKALNKPGWYVVLLCIPLVNLIMQGLIAFLNE